MKGANSAKRTLFISCVETTWLRINENNYQEVQSDTGHATPQVLMEHYNEVAESERRSLAKKVRDDFYEASHEEVRHKQMADEAFQNIMREIADNDDFKEQFLKIVSNMRVTAAAS